MVKYQTADLDSTFAALADPTRRAILARLSQGQASVGELAQPFAMSWPAVTKHLKALERAGLVSRQRQGRSHICRLRAEPLAAAERWITDTQRFWEANLEALEHYLDEQSEKDERKP